MFCIVLNDFLEVSLIWLAAEYFIMYVQKREKNWQGSILVVLFLALPKFCLCADGKIFC